MTPNERIQRIFEDAFPEKLNRPRQVGVEEEFVVIDREGRAGDVPALFSALAEQGWKEKRDSITEALVGVQDGATEISTDVGRGILEVGFAPKQNLHEHAADRVRFLGIIDAELANLGLRRLSDYSVQPFSVPVREHWVKKARALYFRDLFTRNVDAQTASAASQCHVEIERHEILTATVAMNSVAAVLIALTANSPIWAGRLDSQRRLAARQSFWRRFTVGYGYENNFALAEAPASLAELIDIICKTIFIVHVSGSDLTAPGVPFERWLAENPELEESALKAALSSHMGTIWWDARPRQIYGTIEVRPCCQNKDALAHHALILGLVENLEKTAEYVSHMPYTAWRELAQEAEKDGLAHAFLREAAAALFGIAREGLLSRGFGEDTFLAPLMKRIEMRVSPAHIKRNLFEKEGFDAFLASLC